MADAYPQALVVGRQHEHEEDEEPEHVQARIAPYMAMTLARSWRVIAANDCRTRRPVRGDASAVAADTVPPFVRVTWG